MSRGLGDVYKRQIKNNSFFWLPIFNIIILIGSSSIHKVTIHIFIVDILFYTECIINIQLHNLAVCIRQIDNISMCILRIVLIIRLDIATLLAEFRQQICTTNINLSAVPVTVILYLSDNLLQSFLQSTSI